MIDTEYLEDLELLFKTNEEIIEEQKKALEAETDPFQKSLLQSDILSYEKYRVALEAQIVETKNG